MKIGTSRQTVGESTMKSTPVRTRIEAGDTRTLIARLDQLSEASAVRPDPLIQALVDKLPRSHTVWSINDRAKWLKAAATAFNLVYITDEADESDLKIENSPGLKRVE